LNYPSAFFYADNSFFICAELKFGAMKRVLNLSCPVLLAAAAFLGCIACNRIGSETAEQPENNYSLAISQEDVAVLLSSAGVGLEQIREVHDAVSSSLANGYDEEYTMKNVFSSPGEGVGEEYLLTKSSAQTYSTPLRDLLGNYLKTRATKAEAVFDASTYMKNLESSDLQIYWPFSEEWDGETAPVVTFDPGGEASSNIGYTLGDNGQMCRFMITEEYARNNPVWVVNCNEDASQMSLDVVRKNHPEWVEGGNVIIGGATKAGVQGVRPCAEVSELRTLVLKNFTMNRQYDSWFRGASEFFIKIGSVESFTARTESEMYLYDPMVTDFLVVVKRNQLGVQQNLGTVLVSEWTDQLESCAFMIVEDDGGTRTSWNCSAMVKYNSKSYGFDITLPYNSRDDIVWRGQLTKRYIEATNNVTGHFGDVTLTFEIIRYL